MVSGCTFIYSLRVGFGLPSHFQIAWEGVTEIREILDSRGALLGYDVV